MNSTSAERGGVRGLTKRSGCGKSPHPLASLATSPRKRKEVTLRRYRWLLRRLRGLLRQIDRAPAADVVEMGIQEAPGRARRTLRRYPPSRCDAAAAAGTRPAAFPAATGPRRSAG